MKTIASRRWTAICLAVLATVAVRASADQAMVKAKGEKTYTGTVSSVNAKDHVLTLRGFLWDKKFNLGEKCAYSGPDIKGGSVADLRAGQKLTLTYQAMDGVRVVDRVKEIPRHYEGIVKSLNPLEHKLTLRMHGVNREFTIADGCQVRLRNDRSGTLNDVKVGDRATVSYETPDGNLTAREIAQTSATFQGELTAIDLTERTLKAKAAFNSKKFNVGDGCMIALGDKENAHLRDLKPGDKLTFTYDEINGVNIVNRIVPAGEIPPEPVTAQTFGHY